MAKILIYSYNQTANTDLRIQSQAVFLKNAGHDIYLVDYSCYAGFKKLKVKKSDIWENFGIKYFELESKEQDPKIDIQKKIKHIDFSAIAVKIAHKIGIRNTGILNFIKQSIAINTITCDLTLFEQINPDIIISRDLSFAALQYKKKINPNVVIINDFHEIVFNQGRGIDRRLKKIQFCDIKHSFGVITVNHFVTEYYSKFPEFKTFIKQKRVISIPNTPSVELCNLRNPSFSPSDDGKVRFLYHGCLYKDRNDIGINIINMWNKVHKNAILYLRVPTFGNSFTENFLNSIKNDKNRYERIVILDPIEGGFTNEIENTAGLFDVGIIDAEPRDQYQFCSPNRLTTFLHSGLVIFTTNTKFVSEIVSESKSGVIFDHKNEDDIIEKINFLCENPDKLIEIRKNGYKFAKEGFNYENYGQDLLKMLDNALGK